MSLFGIQPTQSALALLPYRFLPPSGTILLSITEELQKHYPTSTIRIVDSFQTRVVPFLDSQKTEGKWDPDFPLEKVWEITQSGEMKETIYKGCRHTTWDTTPLIILQLRWSEPMNTYSYAWIIGPDPESVDTFIQKATFWTRHNLDSVRIFHSGYWEANESLKQDIANTTFNQIILDPTLKESLYQELHTFFSSQEHYTTYNVPWKRGLLFTGPPGNGKTLTIKALAAEFSYPTLYVQDMENSAHIQSIFAEARKCAPCLLVLEDLDVLVKPKELSTLLNELDGFAKNNGILTIATTNHPESLTMALLQRPGRIDQIIPFPVPTQSLREEYLLLCNMPLPPESAMSLDYISLIAQKSEGLSYAFLQEWFIRTSLSRLTLDEAAFPMAQGLLVLDHILEQSKVE